MKTRIIFIILSPLMLLGLTQLSVKACKFQRLRKLYVKKYTNYRDKGLVKDSYCEYYIQAFSEFRIWMFKEFLFKGHYTIKHFFEDTYVYKNMSAYYIKESGDLPFMPELNDIMTYWKTYRQSKA
jgi:hypothetical protein